MAELSERFSGRVDGQLIRAQDWNNLVETIDAQLMSLRNDLSAAHEQIEATETALTNAETEIDQLQGLATRVRDRYRQLEMSATRTTFAIGERAEIIARVTDFDGQPLDLTDPNQRPWVDFVTVWGTLKAAPGFTARAGTGGKTVTIRVDSNGEARALLREQTGVLFDEEEELEISAVLATTIGTQSIAQAFLGASTPAATAIAPAYQIVSDAYERSDTLVMRNYLDGIYLNNPTLTYTPLAPTFSLNWHDEHATVLAFVKPDDSPSTSDSAMAAGSIRVTFRDWVYPWIITQYLPPAPPLVDGYATAFGPLIVDGFEPAVTGIFDEIRFRAEDAGILGQQRQYAAAIEAINVLPAGGQPEYFDAVVQNAVGGLTVQQGLIYSSAVSPASLGAVAPGQAVAFAGVRGENAATNAGAAAAAQSATGIAAAEDRILDQVRAENTQLTNNLLGDNGVVQRVEVLAQDAIMRVDQMDQRIDGKANFEMVSQLLAVRGGP